MTLGESPRSAELPEDLKQKAVEALGYLKELATEFPDTQELQEHLDWLITQCNKVGIPVTLETLPSTAIREKGKKAQYPLVTPLHVFTTDLNNHMELNRLHPPEYQDLYDLRQVLRQALGIRKHRLDPNEFKDQA